eukprot:TRINITY_DN1162_c1_g1_i4.p1 TRINITY_DN1162_c1_g1~~TRINITY_DN1162_c1_g1_i4.p1  ORF type:complete len:467 (+),score=56.95 TRINITY_DN1162_c1_g1_i4:61-1461(+)
MEPLATILTSSFSSRVVRKFSLLRQSRRFSFSNLEALEYSGDGFQCGNNGQNLCRSSEFDCTVLQHRMQEYAKSGLLREALNTLSLMRHVQGRPTVNDYNALMYCYLNSRHVTIAELIDIYEGLKRFGPFPNASTFNTLLNGSLRLEKWGYALWIAEEMCRNGFIPSYSALMSLLRKSLNSGSLVESFSVVELMLRFDYLPKEAYLNSFFSILCRAGRVCEAYFLLSVLLEKGFFPNVYSYNPILLGLCKSSQSAMAMAFLGFLKKRGLTCNAYTYTGLVYGFCREGLYDVAYWVLDKMQNDGCKPTVVTYTTIIKFLCQDGKVKEAKCTLDAMEKGGCSPDLVTCNIMLRALCCHNMILEAIEFIRLMDEKGFCPDVFTCSAFLGGFLKAGHPRYVNELLNDILAKGCNVDAAICNIYFHGLCQVRKIWTPHWSFLIFLNGLEMGLTRLPSIQLCQQLASRETLR